MYLIYVGQNMACCASQDLKKMTLSKEMNSLITKTNLFNRTVFIYVQINFNVICNE